LKSFFPRSGSSGIKGLVRLGLAPALTRAELKELRARASADLRSVGNYVSYLVAKHVNQKGHRRRMSVAANPSEKRTPRSVPIYLTPAEEKKLLARGKAERRSISAYVARVIISELGGR
jgi:hypothetical protein